MKRKYNNGAIVFALLVATRGIIILGGTSNKVVEADTTNFTLTVSGGAITIESPTELDLGEVTTSNVLQNKDISLFLTTDRFYVYDFKGADAGYSTTIEASVFSGVDGSGSNVGTIPSSNFYVLSNQATANFGTGAFNGDVKINSGMLATYVALNGPVLLVHRDTGANLGRVGSYYARPNFRLVVPTWQPVGAYTSVLTYTLYDNAP